MRRAVERVDGFARLSDRTRALSKRLKLGPDGSAGGALTAWNALQTALLLSSALILLADTCAASIGTEMHAAFSRK